VTGFIQDIKISVTSEDLLQSTWKISYAKFWKWLQALRLQTRSS